MISDVYDTAVCDAEATVELRTFNVLPKDAGLSAVADRCTVNY